MKRLLALLLSVISGAALAQTTGAVNPSAAPAPPSANEDVPPGGCMPIGLTAAGEIVFPIQCKEFIERHRGGKDVEQKPAAAAEKPAAMEEKPAAKQSEAVAPENRTVVEQKPAAVEEKPAAKQSIAVAPENSQPADKSVATVPSSKHVEHKPRGRAVSSNDCTHYRTYDPASGTYRGYDGRTRSCR